jgi:hypothetical protein
MTFLELDQQLRRILIAPITLDCWMEADIRAAAIELLFLEHPEAVEEYCREKAYKNARRFANCGSANAEGAPL